MLHEPLTTEPAGVQQAASEIRPWGSWQVLAAGPGYKVKRLHVRPGGRLSYQVHLHRSEHWVVVSGTATCVIDDHGSVLSSGDCTDVPRGARHRLSNEADGELVVVEVQRGDYTGEDDIIRLDDDYGRT